MISAWSRCWPARERLLNHEHDHAEPTPAWSVVFLRSSLAKSCNRSIWLSCRLCSPPDRHGDAGTIKSEVICPGHDAGIEEGDDLAGLRIWRSDVAALKPIALGAGVREIVGISSAACARCVDLCEEFFAGAAPRTQRGTWPGTPNSMQAFALKDSCGPCALSLAPRYPPQPVSVRPEEAGTPRFPRRRSRRNHLQAIPGVQFLLV